MAVIDQIPTLTADQLAEAVSIELTDRVYVQRGVEPTKVGTVADLLNAIAANIAEIQGAKGDPGGDATAIGLWEDFFTLAIPAGVDRVTTTGYGVVGLGAAAYVVDESQANAAPTRSRRKSADGGVEAPARWFRLDEAVLTPEMFGSGFTTGGLRHAATAVSARGGGVVRCRAVVYPPEFTEDAPLVVSNVHFEGALWPEYNNDNTALVNGTVFQGPFHFLGHNVTFSNVGIDSGPTVCTAFYGGEAQEGLKLYVPDQDPIDPWLGIRLHRVRSLCKSWDSPVHAILLEGVQGAKVTDCETIHAGVGLCIKGRSCDVDNHWGRAHSIAPQLDKSDVYAPSHRNRWRNIRHGCIVAGDTWGMRVQAATATNAGVEISGIDGTAGSAPSRTLVSFETTGGNFLTDALLRGLKSDGTSFYGVNVGPNCERVVIEGGVVNNTLDAEYGQAIDVAAGAKVVKISSIIMTNIAGDGVKSAGDDVSVTNSTGTNCAGVAFNGDGEWLSVSNITGTLGGKVKGGGKRPWTPLLNEHVVITPGTGSAAVTGWYLITEGWFTWQVHIALTGDATVASNAGAQLTGLPVPSETGICEAVFLTNTPSITANGFVDGIGGAWLPVWAETAGSVTIKGSAPL